MKKKMKCLYCLLSFILVFFLSIDSGFGQCKVFAKVKPVHCEINTNGSVVLTVTGGTPPYQFQWSNGSQEKDLEDVGEGTYQVTVTDAKGGATTERITVSTYVTIQINLLATDATAKEKPDGSLTAQVIGGKPPYTYQWINLTNAGIRFPSSKGINNLSSGSYLLIVQDANGCSAMAKARVNHSTSAKK